MARTKAPATETLTAGNDAVVPRLKMGESGQPGLNIIGGAILEGCQQELQWPWCIHTFKQMRKDATVSSAIQLLETMISKVKWKVIVPSDASADLLAKKKFLEECIEDMDTSFFQVIKEISSFNTYGFSIMEKVYRKRLKSNGSYYDDGLIGIKGLYPRGQETVAKWETDVDVRAITGFRQWKKVSNGTGALASYEVSPGVFIPREKFLLFRVNARKNSPIGESPLTYCWEAWKFKKALEEAEAIGVDTLAPFGSNAD